MANVHAGYRGILDLTPTATATYLRFTDCSISAKQAVEIPDMVMGDWDHDEFAYGKIEVNGSLSGLVDEAFSNTIWDWGYVRDTCGLLTPKSPKLYYYCEGTGTPNNSTTFTNLYVNSLNFSCAAGDIANWSVDVIGKNASPYSNSSMAAVNYSTTKKLITWDKVSVSITASTDSPTACAPTVIAFQNMEFTVANNVEVVYALQPSSSTTNNLFPYEVVPGIRTITGSLTGFDIDTAFKGFDTWGAYQSTTQNVITFTIGSLTVSFKVRFHRIEPTIGTGPITSTIAFSGVGAQLGSGGTHNV